MVVHGLYLEVDLIGVFMLAVMITGIRRFSSRTPDNRLFVLLMSSVIAILAIDIVTHFADGGAFPGAPLLNVISEVAYFTLSGLLSAIWFLYAYYQARGHLPAGRGFRILLALPCAALAVISALSPRFHLIFYVDAANAYCRGSCFFVQVVITWGYLAAGSILLLYQARRERQRSRRTDLYMMATFALFPLVGSIIQVLCYGLTLLWPMSACALMMIFMDHQNRHIATDGLTGINNRGYLDQHLALQAHRDSPTPLFILLIDVDDFKHINDTYGHSEGDLALIRVAETLKRSVNRCQSGDLLARYGGDEFAIVGRRKTMYAAKLLADEIMYDVDTDNARCEGHPALSLSIGLAYMQPGQTVDDLMRAADESMYETKRQHWAQQAGTHDGNSGK